MDIKKLKRGRRMIKILDADDKILKNFMFFELLELVGIEERDSCPHIYRIYKFKKDTTRTQHDLTLIVRDKHLNRHTFNSIETARVLLNRYTLQGQQCCIKTTENLPKNG